MLQSSHSTVHRELTYQRASRRGGNTSNPFPAAFFRFTVTVIRATTMVVAFVVAATAHAAAVVVHCLNGLGADFVHQSTELPVVLPQT